MQGRERLLRIIAPLLLAAILIGCVRLVLLAGRAPEAWVNLFSLTGVQLVAAFYVPFRLSRERDARFLRIWLGLLLLFACCQFFYAGGVLLAFSSERLTDYPHLPGELDAGAAALEDIAAHLWLHFRLWVVLLPLLLTLAATLLLVLKARFLPLDRISDGGS